jgi:hypothetical protein
MVIRSLGAFTSALIFSGRMRPANNMIVLRSRTQHAEVREAVLRGLRESLRGGDKALVGNSAYRRYLKTPDDKLAPSFERAKPSGSCARPSDDRSAWCRESIWL